ncbi:hypothetical protein DERF_005113 [Dermatophagoides farinae]|uniref:Uncharacterized protein n=1 Tax=Dermatophagoides farinae TaxID=6954 RepID=A0A922L6U4_DERFA|nr:hypothetical protein DERF_005113 [Dermatophagoides farinae]
MLIIVDWIPASTIILFGGARSKFVTMSDVSDNCAFISSPDKPFSIFKPSLFILSGIGILNTSSASTSSTIPTPNCPPKPSSNAGRSKRSILLFFNDIPLSFNV